MTRIYDHELPAWLQPALDELFHSLPTREVLALAKSDVSIGKGFRLTPASAPRLRQRLKTLLDSNSDSTSAIIAALREHSLNSDIIAVLSEQALQRHYRWLMGYFDSGQWLLATLLDNRARVRRLARPWLAATASLDALPTRAECRAHLASELPALLQTETDITTNGATTSAHPVANKRNDITPQQLASLESQLRKQTRMADKLRQQLQTQTDKSDAEKLANNKLRKRLREQTEQLSAKEQQYTKLEKDFSEQLTQQLQAANSALVRYWLKSPEDTVESLQHTDENLLNTIDQALNKQAEFDRHFGNRQRLKQQRTDLLAAIERINDALLNALKPQRNLVSLRKAAQTRVSAINATLDTPVVASTDILQELSIALASAESAAEIGPIESVLEQLQHMGIIDAEQAQPVKTATTRQMEVIFEQASPANENALPSDIRARRAIAMADNAEVLIDGHNCLLAVADIRRRFQSQQQAAGRVGRDWLATACSHIFSADLNCNVLLFFDSDEAREQTVSSNVRVFYSGGCGDQRADNSIIAQLHYLQLNNNGSQRFLISNDTALQREASRTGAAVIDGDVLGNWCSLYTSH